MALRLNAQQKILLENKISYLKLRLIWSLRQLFFAPIEALIVMDEDVLWQAFEADEDYI